MTRIIFAIVDAPPLVTFAWSSVGAVAVVVYMMLWPDKGASL